MDERPVLIGAGQWIERDVDPADAPSPLESIAQCALRAAEDAGIGERGLARLDAVGVVDVIGWRAQNGPRLVAERLGADTRHEILTGVGGDAPLVLVNHVARRIAAGEMRFALLGGSNNLRTTRRARNARVKLDWPQGGAGEPAILGSSLGGNTFGEAEYGLGRPTEVYPLFENALRARHGRGLDAHRHHVGALMSRFTEVAAKNPYAWFPVARSAEEIAEAGPRNRMISYPYTKYMNAVIETDQAAAVLLCSAGFARELGVPEERWVYWRGGRSGTEQQWYPSQREDFARCDAMGAACRGALDEAGVALDAVTHFDFYSCFPSPVQMACDMLGLEGDDPRGLTVTGGLPYGGGPGNNYSMHGLATLLERVRSTDAGCGLVTGNGWYMTKHSATVVSREPSPQAIGASSAPTVYPELPDEIDTTAPHEGAATLLTYTVTYDREGAPERGIVVGETEAGERFVANTPEDRALLEAFVATENVGRAGRVRHVDGRNVFEPA